jgi:hypothetical protein
MPFENLNKPHTECYVFDDPTRVYDLIAWNKEEKLYRLEADNGTKKFLRYFEFCPISSANNELLEAGDNGKIYTVQQLVDAEGHLAWKRPAWAENEEGEAIVCNPWSSDEAKRAASRPLVTTAEAGGPEARTAPPKPKKSQAKTQGGATADPGLADEAKTAVREMLAGCDGRETIAILAGGHLGESPESLLHKYEHLDNGRFRMTIGNRLVGLYKKNGSL